MRRGAGNRLGVLIGVAVLLGLAWWWRGVGIRPSQPGGSGGVGADLSSEAGIRVLAERVAVLEGEERRVAEEVWGSELQAREHGRALEVLWDRFNREEDRWGLLRDFAGFPVSFPDAGAGVEVLSGIWRCAGVGEGKLLDGERVKGLLGEWERGGWKLERLELRQVGFRPGGDGLAAESRYWVLVFLERTGDLRRLSLRGEMAVVWSGERGEEGTVGVASMDLSGLEWCWRDGGIPFERVMLEEVEPPPKSHFIDPVLVHDLEGDGVSEVLLLARNLVYRADGLGGYRGGKLMGRDPGLIFTGLLMDADGDGETDCVYLRREGLYWVKGDAGRFEGEARLGWEALEPIRYGQVLTGGDVDGDGDLDLWLGQYKPPFERGQMPTPYFDANDGYPAYLLINDGGGVFRDGTAGSGLEARRHRRTYSASLQDLSGDGLVDLLVVSDFAGVDFYVNEGGGRFSDYRGAFEEPWGFGMAHVFSDFDGDGGLDVFVTGMHCPTALRLEGMGLTRPGFEGLDAMRGRMTRGNRLYQGVRGEVRYVQTGLNGSVSHSGWSWSPAVADFDNNGYPDLAIANGHETKESVTDYEPEFWTSDIYVATSEDDVGMMAYFGSKFSRTRGRGQSYGGYEVNRMFLNVGGREFVEAGWLYGVGVEEDSRNAVAADLDGDGRSDLVVTTFEAWPRVRQTVRVLRNKVPSAGHWVGLRLRGGDGVSVLGARVVVRGGGREWVRVVTTGDLHRAQQPWDVLVGLGEVVGVDEVEVIWAGGRVTRLEGPAVDCYHVVRP